MGREAHLVPLPGTHPQGPTALRECAQDAPGGPPERRLAWRCLKRQQVPRAPVRPVALHAASFTCCSYKSDQWTRIGSHLCERGPANFSEITRCTAAGASAAPQVTCVAGRTRPAASAPSPLPTCSSRLCWPAVLHYVACRGTMLPMDQCCFRRGALRRCGGRRGAGGGERGANETQQANHGAYCRRVAAAHAVLCMLRCGAPPGRPSASELIGATGAAALAIQGFSPGGSRVWFKPLSTPQRAPGSCAAGGRKGREGSREGEGK